MSGMIVLIDLSDVLSAGKYSNLLHRGQLPRKPVRLLVLPLADHNDAIYLDDIGAGDLVDGDLQRTRIVSTRRSQIGGRRPPSTGRGGVPLHESTFLAHEAISTRGQETPPSRLECLQLAHNPQHRQQTACRNRESLNQPHCERPQLGDLEWNATFLGRRTPELPRRGRGRCYICHGPRTSQDHDANCPGMQRCLSCLSIGLDPVNRRQW